LALAAKTSAKRPEKRNGESRIERFSWKAPTHRESTAKAEAQSEQAAIGT
jgi:hypothetical protein